MNVLTGNSINNLSLLAPNGALYGPAAGVANSGSIGTTTSAAALGGQVGYDRQILSTTWVVGFETDLRAMIGASGGMGSTRVVQRTTPNTAITGNVFVTEQLDYLGTLRGRVGQLVQPNLLIYGTGGLAYGGARSSTNLSAVETPNTGATDMFGSGSGSALLVGFTAGGGVEWLIDRRWSAKLEYLYYNLGTLSYSNSPMSSFFNGTTTTLLTNTSTSSVLFDGHIINVGLNYRF